MDVADLRTLGNVESLLSTVRTALKTKSYRNSYEENNAIASNLERLSAAEQALAMVQTHVHKDKDEDVAAANLAKEAAELRASWTKRKTDREVKQNSKGGMTPQDREQAQSEEEWFRQMREEDEMDQRQKKQSAGGAKKNKKDKKSKKAEDAAADGAFSTKDTQRDTKNDHDHGMERGASLAHLMHPNSDGNLAEDVVAEISTMKPTKKGRKGAASMTPPPAGAGRGGGVAGMYVDSTDDVAIAESGKGGRGSSSATPSVKQFLTVETHKNALFAGIPAECLAGPCTAVPVDNSPMVELRFTVPTTAAMTGDSTPTQCHVTAYRVVVASLHNGPPVSDASKDTQDAIAKAAAAAAQRTTKTSGAVDHAEEGDEMSFILSSDDSDDESHQQQGGMGGPVVSADSDRLSRKAMRHMASFGSDGGDDEYDVLQGLSQQLVTQYLEDEESGRSGEGASDEAIFYASKGRDMPVGELKKPLNHLTGLNAAPWVILMCHGGYFAGAVYVNGRAVVHKAFHRYVVRRKQGGKQSSHDKGGGSQLSAGGQIRRAQELRWKTIVRDILLAWKDLIDQSWMILYVAPGPENRTILTDFSDLPASVGGGTGKGAPLSPVSLKDPRVRSVPLTCHRPTFKEVQRVYDAVSRCTIRFVDPAGSGASSPVSATSPNAPRKGTPPPAAANKSKRK